MIYIIKVWGGIWKEKGQSRESQMKNLPRGEFERQNLQAEESMLGIDGRWKKEDINYCWGPELLGRGKKKNPRLGILIQDEAIYKNSTVGRKNKKSHHPMARHNHMPVGQHVKAQFSLTPKYIKAARPPNLRKTVLWSVGRGRDFRQSDIENKTL